jgi:hypothetical protein
MKIITLITIVIIAWLIYSLIQSHHNIEKELREIRIKCVLPNNSSTPSSNNDKYSNPDNYPLNSIKTGLISNLTSLLPNN